MKQLPLAMPLRERAVFDNFVVGPNAAIVEHLRASALGANRGTCWLSGASGMGKSHLLQATCTLALGAGRTALYLPLSQLIALGPAALQGWPPAAVVAIDEITVILGQRDWERALFNVYRDIEEHGGALLVASSHAPARLGFFLPDLASRFVAAMLLPLRPLDEAGQRSALQLRARARGLDMPDDTALYLQRRFRRDLPTLYGLLDAIDAASLQAQRRLTVPFIRQVLGQWLPERAE